MEYKVQTNDKPTIFNEDAALGSVLIPLATLAVGGFLGATAPLSLPIMAAIAAGGGLFGGLIGRARMSREVEEGKAVKEPTMFNKRAATGAGLGYFAGAMLGALAAFAFPAIGVAGTVAVIGGLIGVAAGALIGGKSGKDKMHREFDAAEQAQAQQDRLVAIARARQLEMAASEKPSLDKEQNALAAGALGAAAEPRQLPPGNPDGAMLAGPNQYKVIQDNVLPADNIAIAGAPPTTQLQDESPSNVTLVDNKPTNNTTVITGGGDQPQPEPHTHNITTNTYTTVISATPNQPPASQQDGATINNTVLAASDSTPTNAQVTQPESTNAMLVAAADQQPAPVQNTGADATGRQPIIRISISGDGVQPAIISGQPDGGDKSFTAALLSERDQQQGAPAAQDKKGPTTSYATNVTTERQQPVVQVNTV